MSAFIFLLGVAFGSFIGTLLERRKLAKVIAAWDWLVQCGANVVFENETMLYIDRSAFMGMEQAVAEAAPRKQAAQSEGEK